VLDAMIYVQAASNANGPSYAIIRRCAAGDLTVFMSDRTWREISEVLGRFVGRKKGLALAPERISRLLAQVGQIVTWLTGVPDAYRYPRDVDDEPYINLAIAADADYLVSRDKDLLDLMDESTVEGADFLVRFPKLRIIDPAALLRALEDTHNVTRDGR
jgi:putative PIN family toxin of toxin-antitoxin system